jgi:putative FmdB family regulatory protein
MPLYEFHCSECQSTFEELVRVSAPAEDVTCPKCGSHQVRRKVSTFASKTSGGSNVSASAGSCAPSG